MKKFKNEFGVVSESKPLLIAFKEEVEKLGWIYDEEFTPWDRLPNNNCLYFADHNDTGACLKPNHFSLSGKDKNTYYLPQQYEEALKAASEVVEEIPEYVEFIDTAHKGKIVKVVEWTPHVYCRVRFFNGDKSEPFKYLVKPSTKEAYDAQNTPTLNVGDWLSVIGGKKINEKFHGDLLQITSIIDEDNDDNRWVNHTNYSFSGGAFRWNNGGKYPGYKLGIDFRLATPEEIAKNTKKSNEELLQEFIIESGLKVGDVVRKKGNFIVQGEITKFTLINETNYTNSSGANESMWEETKTPFLSVNFGNFAIPAKLLEKTDDVILTLGSTDVKVTISKGKIKAKSGEIPIGYMQNLYEFMSNTGINRTFNWRDTGIAGLGDSKDISFPNVKLGCTTFTIDEVKLVINTYKKLND